MHWTFDRPARLRAIADRTGRLADHLRRELADAPRGSAARAALAARIAIVERRLARFRMLARVARHNARASAAA
jgi:hypothetical protein